TGLRELIGMSLATRWARKSARGKKLPSRRLRLELLEDRNLLAPLATIVPIAPDPRFTPVGQVAVNFNEAVSGVDISDFKLTRNGLDVSLVGVPLSKSNSDAEYFLDLTNVTQTAGNYQITLVADQSGIKSNNDNLPLLADASDSWDELLAA